MDHCLGLLPSWTFIYMKNNGQQYSLLFSWLFCSQGFSFSTLFVVVWNLKISKWEESWTTLMLQLYGWSVCSLLPFLPASSSSLLIYPVYYFLFQREARRGQEMAWPRAYFGEVSGLLKIIPPFQELLKSTQ